MGVSNALKLYLASYPKNTFYTWDYVILNSPSKFRDHHPLPPCSQNLLRINAYTVQRLINPIYAVIFALLMLLVLSSSEATVGRKSTNSKCMTIFLLLPDNWKYYH